MFTKQAVNRRREAGDVLVDALGLGMVAAPNFERLARALDDESEALSAELSGADCLMASVAKPNSTAAGVPQA